MDLDSEPSRELPISGLKDSLTDALEYLDSTIRNLDNRLAPYMRTDYSEKALNSDLDGPVPDKSSIVSYFENKIITVKHASIRIDEILNRLDI